MNQSNYNFLSSANARIKIDFTKNLRSLTIEKWEISSGGGGGGVLKGKVIKDYKIILLINRKVP